MHIIFFFNDTATTEIYTLSLHDALPISSGLGRPALTVSVVRGGLSIPWDVDVTPGGVMVYTERAGRLWTRVDRKSTRLNLQSRQYLVCRLLLEKKKT